MSGGNGRPVPFRVDMLQRAREDIEAIAVGAKPAGTLPRFTAALAFIVWRLETNPLGFGEPTHHLWHMDMVVHVGAHRPVVIHFGVHAGKRFVVIQRVALLPS